MSKRRCDGCQLLRINGMACHETGCPEAWRDYGRECAWCGSAFAPEDRRHRFCSEDCGRAYHGEDELPGEGADRYDDPPEWDVAGGL